MEPVILPQCETWLHTRKQALTKLKALYGNGYRYIVRDKDSEYLYCYSLQPKKFRDLQGWGYVEPDGPGVLPAFPIKNVDMLEISWSNRSAVLIERVLQDKRGAKVKKKTPGDQTRRCTTCDSSRQESNCFHFMFLNGVSQEINWSEQLFGVKGRQIMKNQEMVKVECWTLHLTNFETDEIEFYYNHVEDKFVRHFNTQCAFLDEKSCLEKEGELNIVGLQSVSGTMDYPRELLINIITDVFTESGLM